MSISPLDFIKAHKKVKLGKKKLSDREFLKFRSQKNDNLNSLGKFFYDKQVSLSELGIMAEEFNRKNYKLTKYICVVLPKGPDDYRPILVPAPRDRILFSFILDNIENNFLKEIGKFRVFGSGKREDYPNIKRILSEVYKESKKHNFILKIDISKFFPSIDQGILFKKMEGHITDPYILKIIKDSFNNEIEIKFTKQFSADKKLEIQELIKKGIPQGCAYSPLLANFYGLDLDTFAKNEGKISFRYLDDMIIFVESETEANKIFKKLKTIANGLNLRVHDIDNKNKNKTYIQKANHTFEYLGMEIKSDGTYEIPLSKIRKQISLIKTGIFNKRTIKKFNAEKVLEVLTLQLKGWRTFYKGNFPSAYESLKAKTSYNSKLEKYYKTILYSSRVIKKDLKNAGFDIKDPRFYL